MDAVLGDKTYISKVQVATYQGLIANLATFCAKEKKGSEASKLPRIFLAGGEVSFDSAVASLLTEDEIHQHKVALKIESRMKAEKKRGKQVASTDFTVTGITMNAAGSTEPPVMPGLMSVPSPADGVRGEAPEKSFCPKPRSRQRVGILEGGDLLATRLRNLQGALQSATAVSGRLLLAFAIRGWRLAPRTRREERRLVEAWIATAQEAPLRRLLAAWRRAAAAQHRGRLTEVREDQQRLARMLSKREAQMRSLGVVPWLTGPLGGSALVQLMLARWRSWALQSSGARSDRRHVLARCLRGWQRVRGSASAKEVGAAMVLRLHSRRMLDGAFSWWQVQSSTRLWVARACGKLQAAAQSRGRAQERTLLRRCFGRWLAEACSSRRLQNLRQQLWPLFEGLHRAVITTLAFYRWHCWAKRSPKATRIYSHTVLVQTMRQRAAAELAFRAWRGILRRREANRHTGKIWMEASAASELWAWAARLHAQVARARLARRAAQARQAGGIEAPAPQTLQSIIEAVLAQARAAALLAAWRWVVQEAEVPEPPEPEPAHVQEAGQEAREVLTLCETLEWQNADLQVLLRERAMENARLETELTELLPLQR
ncbi:unnamed protein product [Symbiodinium natans]|uniref:Uncharacterized protein n=1 Tax=Symbiodinium natans TaxID=878477 RepID=A0A812RII9_9DINO|nr:unnamed protein product [Symbiodinium natans]